MRMLSVIIIVFCSFLTIGCNPLPPTKVVVGFTDNRRAITCNEVEPIFAAVSNSIPISLSLDTKVDADTCIWRGTVDVEPPGETKMFAIAFRFSGIEFGDTVVNMDTTGIEHTIGGIMYDISLSSSPVTGTDVKKKPLFSRRSMTWDTLYFSMNNYGF